MPPKATAMPTTTLGWAMCRVLTLYKDKMSVVEAKAKSPLKKKKPPLSMRVISMDEDKDTHSGPASAILLGGALWVLSGAAFSYSFSRAAMDAGMGQQRMKGELVLDGFLKS